MKITNESVAKALGFQEHKNFYNQGKKRGPSRWDSPQGEILGNAQMLPPFTTSLDCIVAEIEARGLHWGLSSKEVGGYQASIYHHNTHGHAEIAPLALCAALLAYLKSKE